MGKKIFLAIVILLVGYGIVNGIVRSVELKGLSRDLRAGSESAKVAAATRLMKIDRLYDVVQAMQPKDRIKAMDAVDKTSGELTVKQSLILLKDTDKDVRARVVKVLIGAAKDHVDLLIPAMKDSDENVRNGAKDALVGIGPKVISLVQPAAKIVDTRGAAIDVLIRLGVPSVPPVVALLKEDDQDTRMAAASALGKIKSMDATPALMVATKDIKAVRMLAISSLCDICDPRSSDLLISVLIGSQDGGEVRARTARALSVIGGAKASAALVSVLGDLDLKVRSSSISGLQRMGDPVVGVVAAKLSDPSKIVRESAARCLEQTNSPAAAAVLVRMAKDADPAVRASSANGLGVQTAAGHPDVLIAMLSDSADEVGEAAVASLIEIGVRTIPGLMAVLKSSPSETARYRAAEALSGIGPDSVPALLAVAGGDVNAQRWAAYALGRTGDQRAKPTLERLAKASDPDLAAVAKRALSRM